MLSKIRIVLGLSMASWMYAEAPLTAQRQGHTLLLPGVFLNGHGPLLMMVDTGASASTLRPEVAQRLGLRPRYQVEQVTAAGSRMVAAALASVRVGHVQEEDVEVLIADAAWAGVDGVLGQSFLVRRDYELDYEHGRIEFDAGMPETGVRLPLEMADGRPAIPALVDGQRLALILDSGASTLLLFRMEAKFRERARLVTNTGSIEAGLGQATVEFTGAMRKKMQAAELPLARTNSLMPACVFRRVYVASRTGVVVLDGKTASNKGK